MLSSEMRSENARHTQGVLRDIERELREIRLLLAALAKHLGARA